MITEAVGKRVGGNDKCWASACGDEECKSLFFASE
jgi:hypothetical protein